MGSAAIMEIVKHFLGPVARTSLEKKMRSKVPDIAKKMAMKGLTPESATLPVLVRDALFRLWRGVIPSGDMADFVRDRQSEKVVALVAAAGGDHHDLSVIVGQTLDALLAVTF